MISIFSCAADTVDDLMREAMTFVRDNGHDNHASRGPTKEVIGALFELTNPRARLSRTEKRRRVWSAVAELCWYLRGTNEVEPIAFWIERYREEAEADGRVNGGYGPRLFGDDINAQVRRVTELLRAKPNTRRAVVQIFDRRDISVDPPYKEVPCTCTMQFLIRNSTLNLVVSMRSNDVYIGLPHDVFTFTMLQEIIARDLDIEPGVYLHAVGSLHMYDEDFESAQQFLDEGWQSTDDPMSTMPPGDQWSHIAELLTAEGQLRDGSSYANLELPSSPYWADLARLLALRLAKKNAENDVVDNIRSDFYEDSYRAFA